MRLEEIKAIIAPCNKFNYLKKKKNSFFTYHLKMWVKSESRFIIRFIIRFVTSSKSQSPGSSTTTTVIHSFIHSNNLIIH